MKKIVLILTMAVIFGWQVMSFADTSSVDALIQKLEDKGILTDQDANQIKGEIASSEQTSQQATFKTLLPDWINNIKLTGDMRIRLQTQIRRDRSELPNTSAGIDNNRVRGRFRARLNLEDQVNDKLKVVFGIATDGYGGASGSYGFNRSNNYTFGGNNSIYAGFGKDTVVVNKAYAQYTPTDSITVDLGKMDNPIWEPGSPFLWDPNITPEGGAILLQKKINDMFTPWATGEADVLQNTSTGTTDDIWMTAFQAGAKGNLTDKIYYKGAFDFYSIEDPQHATINIEQRSLNFSNTPMTWANGAYLYSFGSIIGGTAEIGMNDPLGELLDNIPTPDYLPHPYIAQIGVFGSYTHNPDPPSGDGDAWQIGGYMGNSVVNGWGTWRLSSAYKVIERDAWLDVLPDYDFYTGDTDVSGWRNELDIGLMKNVYFSFQLYATRVYKPFQVQYASTLYASGTGPNSMDAPNREILTQADLNIKF